MPAPDLISRAARFFVLAEQTPRFWFSVNAFWELSVPLVVETATHLPAMAAAVRTVAPLWQDILWSFARYPLPAVFLPEAVPWHNHLVAAWEVHRASSDAELQNIARLALVRLDGCGMPDGQQRPSRLPEWLAEVQTIVGAGSGTAPTGDWDGRPAGRPYPEMEALATLAAWRPAPRVVTPPETLRAWVDFWMEMRQSAAPMERGIAAIALLNLPEADLRAASIPPVPTVELLRQLTTAIQVAAKKTDQDYLFLLDWQPVKGTTWPVAEVTNVAQTWLDATRHNDPNPRWVAWRQLIRWDRAGSLDICGIDLLPELVKAVRTEKNEHVLWVMAQWAPNTERFAATETPDGGSQLLQLERAWRWHRYSVGSWNRASAWLAGIRLHQAGLAAETPDSFLKVCISHLAEEWNDDVLFALAHWSPGTDASGRWYRDWHAAWQKRLLDKYESIRKVTAWAFLRQFLEKASDRSPRGVALELWRAGVKVSPEARHILGAAFARFQEVRAHLAAGEVPDFETKPTRPTERCRPPLALPPGRIAGGEWKMENEEWKMENGKWRMKDQEVTAKPNHHLNPNRPSR